MASRYKFSENEIKEIEQARKENKDKRKAVDRLCDTICSLSNQVISSITGGDWIMKLFN